MYVCKKKSRDAQSRTTFSSSVTLGNQKIEIGFIRVFSDKLLFLYILLNLPENLDNLNHNETLFYL